MKKYANAAVVYGILALVGGVFYREFTKFNGFEGTTALGFVHVHYFALGVLFLLLLMALAAQLGKAFEPGRALVAYHVGLNLSVAMLVVRGVIQVLGTELSAGATAAISGIAGVGHIVLGVSLVMLLLRVRRAALV